MKKLISKYIIVGLTALTAISACKKPGDFGDLNYSPNDPKEAHTALLMANAMTGIGNIVNQPGPRLYTQQLSETFYTSESRYNTKVYSYNTVYSNPLEDLSLVIKLNNDPATKNLARVKNGGSNANQIAVSRILTAYYILGLTDRWGDVPYTGILQGLANPTPDFDKQQAIYTALFKELKEAVAQMDGGGLGGDILFNGSVAKWKQFANTTRLMMALRLSKVDPATGQTEFKAALASGVLGANADNIYYKYLSETANQNNIYNNYEVGKRYDYAISNVMVNALVALSDPRLPVYADTTASKTYKGMPYGLTQGQAGAYPTGTVAKPGSISLIGKKFRQQNSWVAIYSYAQVQFAIAEAHKLGWITGAPDDAQAATAYLAGINASMAENGVTPDPSYFTQAGVAYDPANALQQILSQKWIANYMGNGFETWNDWRRTGFPTLTPTPNAQNLGKQIPRRQCYATTERDLNNANYQKVIASQGPDELNTRIWWDKP